MVGEEKAGTKGGGAISTFEHKCPVSHLGVRSNDSGRLHYRTKGHFGKERKVPLGEQSAKGKSTERSQATWGEA